MPNHHASLCQRFLFLFHFECTTFPALRQHLHQASPQSWPLTHISTCDPKESVCSVRRWKKGTWALSFPHALPFCLSALQHWQDLVALGSCCANNILDQSSLVTGQHGFKQRGKKRHLSQAKISRAARFNRFSEEVTFAVVTRAFWGVGVIEEPLGPGLLSASC